jgi:Fic family protein
MPSWDVHFDVRIRVDEPRLVRAVERSRAIAETIRGIPVTTNVRKRLNALNIARAVRGTAAIEGTRISEEEALEVLDAPADVKVLPPDRSRDEHEARNAQAVLRFVRRELRANPERRLDEPLIREIHRLTTEGVPYKGNEPGQYRNHAVSAGDYRPPASGDEVRRLMSDFVRWFDEGTAAAWDPIVRAAIAHFYVVSIHPFGDGNGRASRGVESFMLYRAGINAFGFYSLANFYYQNRDAYVDALTAARFRSRGDLTDFVLFAVEGLATELEGVRRELMSMIQVIAFWEYARQKLGAVDGLGELRRTRMLSLIRRLTSAQLASGPHENVDTSAILAGVYRRVGARTTQRDLRTLLDHELVVERDGQIVPNVEIMSKFTEA